MFGMLDRNIGWMQRIAGLRAKQQAIDELLKQVKTIPGGLVKEKIDIAQEIAQLEFRLNMQDSAICPLCGTERVQKPTL